MGKTPDYFLGSREELGRPPPVWGRPRIAQLAALLYGGSPRVWGDRSLSGP
ncbi:hypothetical protein ACIHCM_34645 [Streptomyces sp. NPDC052023]|uniref:hypothetical protein n=1 Tax=Streptomyces sp. NPDC052023 TaxID=3365681 RepID=UPI0037D39ED9